LDSQARAKAEEQEKQLAEEAKRKEEQKAIKKQREKERIDQLKKEGKFLTKAQKEEKARNELKLQQMLAAGIKIGPQEEEGAPKKKVVYDSKKKRGKNDKVMSALVSSIYLLFSLMGLTNVVFLPPF
jgi:translation initiation factor 5B